MYNKKSKGSHMKSQKHDIEQWINKNINFEKQYLKHVKREFNEVYDDVNNEKPNYEELKKWESIRFERVSDAGFFNKMSPDKKINLDDINNIRLYDAYRIKFDPYKESNDSDDGDE